MLLAGTCRSSLRARRSISARAATCSAAIPTRSTSRRARDFASPPTNRPSWPTAARRCGAARRSSRASSVRPTAASRSVVAAMRRGRSSTSSGPDFPADRLLVCEVFTPGGNWSSYPPHKHDTDRPPGEVELEEIYYYRFAEPDAYGFQRLYDERRDRTLLAPARRRRADPARLSPVRYSVQVQRVLPERAGRNAAIDGGERRSPLRVVSRLAASRDRSCTARAAPPRRARVRVSEHHV